MLMKNDRIIRHLLKLVSLATYNSLEDLQTKELEQTDPEIQRKKFPQMLG